MRKTLFALVVLAGCAADEAQSTTRSAPAEMARKPRLDPPKKAGESMSDFKPNTAFRAHAAKILGVAPADLQGGAIDAATAKTMPNSVGNAWAFTMWFKTDHAREVRGWVTPDGTVITPDANLGLLLVEAGAWGKHDQTQYDELADKLAKLLVWALGPNLTVADDPSLAMPSLTMAANHTGKLHFFINAHQVGPGGASGGPNQFTEIAVALSADHKATLAKTPKK